MELNWLEDFVSLANTGSFSKAAELRNISQSAFSRRIHSLESWLGTTLVDRHSHPVTLTDPGTQLLGSANLVIRTMYKAREASGYRESTKPRTLALGAADHLAIYFLPSWLQSIADLLGKRKIQLMPDLRPGLGFVELLKEQKLDFLLAYGGSVSKEDHDAGLFESLVLGQDLLVPVCKSSLLAARNFQFPADPENPIPFVSYMPGSAMTKMINRHSLRRRNPVHLDPVVETGTAQTIKSLVLAGFGMGWVPHIAIQKELELGTLSEMGDESHRIRFSIELFRYKPNTRPDLLVLWDRLKALN